MRRISKKWSFIPGLAVLCVLAAMPAHAELYPGVYSSDDCLIFIQAEDEYGALQGIVVLSYEYSTEWVITSAEAGALTDTGLLLTVGHQYVYNADGSKSSEMEFSSLEMAVDWDSMTFHVLPSYGHFLAPMVRGGLAYSLVETRAGLPSQLVLAREAFEIGSTVNLFEGFLYQLSEGELTGQVAFTEVAFGTQGLVRGNFPEDFPPPPEDYPVPYPEYTDPSYPPPVNSNTQTPSSGTEQIVYIDPMRPQGTEIPPEERIDRPHFTLEPMHDYDVPPITRIGVVAFQGSGDEEDYAPLCDQYLQDALEDIDGVEVVYIPYDGTRFGGAVMYDRAVWLCEEYGVEALMLSDLNKLDMPGGEQGAWLMGSVRVNVEMGSRLVEGVGGSTLWSGEFDSSRNHDSYEFNDGAESVLREDLFRLIRDMVDDLVENGTLDGGHID